MLEANLVDDWIDAPEGGTAVIRGTNIEAHRIAALLDGGAGIDGVLRDYPSLIAAQVAAAAAYAEVHPHQGIPYPSQSAKAAMRAGLGGLQQAFAAAYEE